MRWQTLMATTTPCARGEARRLVRMFVRIARALADVSHRDVPYTIRLQREKLTFTAQSSLAEGFLFRNECAKKVWLVLKEGDSGRDEQPPGEGLVKGYTPTQGTLESAFQKRVRG